MPTPALAESVPGTPSHPPRPRSIEIALLGAGGIGSALARRIGRSDHPPARIVRALVRDPGKPREAPFPAGCLTTDADAVFDPRPDVVVELLGGVEPAATLVARALSRGIPVVTANKSMLAARGAELAALAVRAGVPLLYEAAVLAGVPFLGALASRASAAAISRLEGIVNGTCNVLIGALAEGTPLQVALADATRRGLAEPRPDNDLHGVDAAEKLAVLLRHLRWGEIEARGIETGTLEALTPADLAAAAAFGGVIKPVVFAARRGHSIEAFSGPAFLPSSHRLARVDGVENAIVFTTPHGTVVHGGPGAGPDATAATILDDAIEAAGGCAWQAPVSGVAVQPGEPHTGWFVRLAGAGALPPADEIADFLGAHGIWMRRSSTDPLSTHHLTYPAPKARLDRALASLGHASGLTSLALRTLEA